jgi:hypothetical protein
VSTTRKRDTRKRDQINDPDETDDDPAILIGFRDEWISGVLSDFELSPTARMVGAYLGLAVDLNNWPSIPSTAIGPQLRTIVARLGLPVRIVAMACNALARRGRLDIVTRAGRLHRIDLTDAPSRRLDLGGGRP